MLRVLYKTDLSDILKIESSVNVVPWDEMTFQICFNGHYAGWVIEQQKKIIGFIIASFQADECHILNLGIAHEYQHLGWGKKLLSYTLNEAKKKGFSIAYLEVRKSNDIAIALYTHMHFQLIGERKNYYPTVAGKEDALIFAKSL